MLAHMRVGASGEQRTMIIDALNPKESQLMIWQKFLNFHSKGHTWSLILRTTWKSPQPWPVYKQKTEVNCSRWKQFESFLRINGVSAPLQTWCGLSRTSPRWNSVLLSLSLCYILLKIVKDWLASSASGVFMIQQIEFWSSCTIRRKFSKWWLLIHCLLPLDDLLTTNRFSILFFSFNHFIKK